MCLKRQSSLDKVGKEFGVSGTLREGACGSIMESKRESGAEEAGEVSRGCRIWSGRLYRAQPCSIRVKKN